MPEKKHLLRSTVTTNPTGSEKLPLEWTETFEYTAEGVAVLRREVRRGLVKRSFTTRSDAEGQLFQEARSPATQWRSLAAALRRYLAGAGLPTDANVWIRVGDGEWRPDLDLEIEIDEPYQLRSWHEQLVAVTQILSKGHLAGNLLNAINNLEQCTRREQFPQVCLELCMAYQEFATAGFINEFAMKGQKTARSLAGGSKVRKQRGATVREVVCKHASQYWDEKPAMRGDQSNTAAAIALAVNQELRSLRLGERKSKTIADQIRRGIGEGILRNGQSPH